MKEVGQSQRELREELECNCWDVLGRCARSYMHVRWQCVILSRSAKQKTCCL